MTALLIGENGQEVDVGAVLAGKPAFILGADTRCHLVIAGAAASHATINRTENGYSIKPILPSREVAVNGVGIERATPLNPGDYIAIAGTELAFRVDEREITALVKQAVLPSRSPQPAQPVISAPVMVPRPALAPAAALTSAEPVIHFPQQDTGAGTNMVAIIGSLSVLVMMVGFLAVMLGSLNNPGGQVALSIPAELAGGGQASMIMFEADWCTYCRQQKPIVNRLEREYVGLVEVRHINIDDMRNRRLVAEYNARSIPLIAVLDRDGKVVAIFRGLQREETLRAALERAIV